MELRVVLIFISLMDKDVGHVKKYILGIHLSSFENSLFISLAHLLSGSFVDWQFFVCLIYQNNKEMEPAINR